MRLHSGPLRSTVEATGKILDASGEIPRAPEALGGKSFTELVENGDIKVTIDEKYPQALGINGIKERVNIWGNSAWDIAFNEHAKDSPFFTSDFPSGIELSDDPRIINRLLPLAPDLALRIRPDPDAREFKYGRDVQSFSVSSPYAFPERSPRYKSSHCQVRRRAHLFSGPSRLDEPFLNKHRSFRVEPTTTEISTPTGYALVSTIRIKSTKNND